MKYARLSYDKKIVEFIPVTDEQKSYFRFDEDLIGDIMAVPDEAKLGDVFHNGLLYPTENTTNPIAEELGQQQKRLELARIVKIEEIKTTVRKLLSDLDWKVQRAQERDYLGLGSDLSDVMIEKENIRRSGNEAEQYINTIGDISLVTGYTFAVQESLQTFRKLSRVEFLSRFTKDEMDRILDKAKINPTIESFILRLQAAEYINLDDPVTGIGIDMLIAYGLINSTRKSVILG